MSHPKSANCGREWAIDELESGEMKAQREDVHRLCVSEYTLWLLTISLVQFGMGSIHTV